MKFNIKLNNLLGGFAPGYWKATYPTFGNNNQAADIVSCDLTNPQYLQQGVGLATVTGTVSALMKGISGTVLGANEDSYGIGGTGIYKVEPNAVTNVYTIKASTGFKFPTGNAEPAAPFNGQRWTDINNAYASDSTFATADISASFKSDILKTFDFSAIPDGATITGIEVLVEAKVNTQNANAFNLAITLTKDGANGVGTGKATSALTTSSALYILGDSNNLWGTTWTKAELVATTFGTLIVTSHGTAAGIIYSIDSIRVNVYYTPSSEDGESIDTITGSDLIYTHGTKVGYSNLTTFNDEVYSSLISGVPHQFKMIPGSTIGFLTNGYKLIRFNYPANTLSNYSEVLTFTTDTALTNTNITSQEWHNERLWLTVNFPNFTGRKKAMLYSYNGSGDTYERSIPIDGEVGVCYAKDGILYVIYKKNYEDGVCTLAYCDGYKLVDIQEYYGSLPQYYQVSTYKDFLIWMSGTDIMCYGSGVTGSNNRLFKLGVGSTGGIANPFGTPVVAFADALKKFSGYTVTSSWKSLLFDINMNGQMSIIDGLGISFEKLSSGASVAITLKDNQGNTLLTDTISYTTHPNKTFYYRPLQILTNNFRVELDFSGGSVTNPVQIKNINIYGLETAK